MKIKGLEFRNVSMHAIDAENPTLPSSCSSGMCLIAAGVVGLGVGLGVGNPGLVAASIVLIGVPTVAYLLVRRSLEGLRVTRVAPGSVVEGDSVEVWFELVNESRIPLFFPVVAEVSRFEDDRLEQVLFAGRVLSGERLRRGYLGHCLASRGVYPSGAAVVQAQDPFGWFSLRRRIAFDQTLTVFPSVSTLGLTDINGRRMHDLCGDDVHPSPGWSSEFLKVREYQAGDSPRHVHWGLTARLQYPVLREFTSTAGGELHIVLDLSCEALIGSGRNSSLEHAVRIAASVAADAIEERKRVGLIAGSDPQNAIPADSGPMHLRRILRGLVSVSVSPAEHPLPEQLQALDRQLGHRDTVVIMVSEDLTDGGPVPGLLEAWHKRGRRIVPVRFFESQFPHHPRPTDADGSTGYAPGWRRRLEALGVETFDVPCCTDFDPTHVEGRGAWGPRDRGTAGRQDWETRGPANQPGAMAGLRHPAVADGPGDWRTAASRESRVASPQLRVDRGAESFLRPDSAGDGG